MTGTPTALWLTLLLFASPLLADDFTGDWHGAVELPGTKLEFSVRLQTDGDTPAGTISIPAQALRNFALAPVTVDGRRVRFVMPGIPGEPTFVGELSGDNTQITGTLAQGGQSFPFTLDRGPAPLAPGQTPDHGLPGEGLVGHWQGSLRLGALELRLVLHVEQDDLGDLRATLDSLDQGAFSMPVSSVALDGTKVTFALDDIHARYEGALSDEGASIVGSWTQGQTRDLTFFRLAAPPQLRRPQDPVEPYPYKSQDVTFPNEEAGITLAGTLTRPLDNHLPEGPYPAVILVTGSGPQNRDEALMGHRPFLVLADSLTRRGIVVLRYDDRGVGASGGDFSQAVQKDFVSDAKAAVAYLRTRPEVDGDRVGVIGHSEGGLVAPRVAAEDDRVAFIVLMAGVGVPVGELLDRQTHDMLALAGTPRDIIDKHVALRHKLVTLVSEQGNTPETRAEAKRLILEAIGELSETERKALGTSPESVASQQVAAMFTPWYMELSSYDPRPYLAQVSCPVLAVNGDLDMQVAADDNLLAIRDALAAGRNPPATIVKLPGLNHLFQPAKTGGIYEYAQINTTIDPSALSTIGEWITQQTRPR